MKSAVIVFPASNCDRDAKVALQDMTGKAPAMAGEPLEAEPHVDRLRRDKHLDASRDHDSASTTARSNARSNPFSTTTRAAPTCTAIVAVADAATSRRTNRCSSGTAPAHRFRLLSATPFARAKRKALSPLARHA